MLLVQSAKSNLNITRGKSYIPALKLSASTVSGKPPFKLQQNNGFSTNSLAKNYCLNSRSPVFSNHVRHSHKMGPHKMYDVDQLKLPHKYWGWLQRLFMYRYFGGQFDADSFFKGVVMTFVYVSECIAKDKTGQLHGVLTDEAMEDIPLYTAHALHGTSDAYDVDEKDIVYLHVKSSKMESLQNYENSRNAQVLTLGVWITYIKDFQKKLDEKDVVLEDSMKEHLHSIRDVMVDLLKENKIARFHFQRVYDQELKNPLSDWSVSGIYYNT